MQANELIEKWAREQPEKVYLYYRDEQVTYAQLLEGVTRVAGHLKSLGIGPGDRVALYLRNSPDFLYAWFALNRLGAVMVPINTALKAAETAFIIRDSGCRGVIAEPDALDTVVQPAVAGSPSVEWIAVRGDSSREGILSFNQFLQAEPCTELPHWPEDDLAAILYTSGTTANPKGVMCPYRYYSAIGKSITEWLGLNRDDRWLTLLPLFHMNAETTSTMGSLTLGASLILLDGFNPGTFWKDVSRYEATVVNYLGSMLPVLLKVPVTPEETSHRVRLAVGAQADPGSIEEYERRWGFRIVELYGMTEIGGSCNPVEGRKIGSCGLPFIGHSIRIVDDEGRNLPPQAVGEIVVSGPSITLGYWQNPEETAKTYRNGWVFTGDMGHLDEDGFLYFVARRKDMIRRSGENISAVEVENVVMSHPRIVEATAIPVPDPFRGEEVKIYVVLRPGETPDAVPPEEIIRWCEERLAKFKIPRYVEYRESLPKTATQKIQKTVLRSERPDLTAGAWDRFAGKQRKE